MFKKIFSTKMNAAANFAGSIWTALLGLIFVPVYLHYIGIESYGLIGIFNSIIAFIVLLDFGLSPTLNRELARLSILDGRSQQMHDLKRTLEIVNWIIAACIALLFTILAPFISRYWIQPQNLTVEAVTQALLIMSVNVAIQFSINFYVGGLMGLQKQLLLNAINIICSTLRFGGAFLVLAFFSPTITAFLFWQGLVFLFQAVLMAITLRLSLPTSKRKALFQKDLLRKIGKFAAGMTAISVVSLILTQTDKIILSKMLNLETFGYYTLAVTISTMSISVVINSIAHAVYPQFSKFVATGAEDTLRGFYHHCCQIASVFLFPIIVMMALYSYDILLIWTQNEKIASNTYILLSIVAVGTGLNGLMWLPYFLQLAHGWTKLTLYINIAAIFILIPLMIYGVFHYGAIGGAVSWVALNALYILVSPQIMHSKILKGEQWKWYFQDLLLPFLGAFAIALLGKWLFQLGGARIEIVAQLALISITAFLMSALSTKATRGYLRTGKIFSPSLKQP